MWYTKLLAVLFVFVFNLNGVFIVSHEALTWQQMSSVFRYLRCSEKKDCAPSLLFLDAFTNCYMVVMCCVCATLALAQSATPKDVLFDALALFFLYNLDDIGGELAIGQEDDWPGCQLAWVHYHIQREESCPGPGWPVALFSVTAFLVAIISVLLPILLAITDYQSLILS
mmetsp:Transcript_9540/g.24359  ORF Transcript_9540/g.24359 Transcript_9540/m.24359 type:complete len:170 (+) Transcript_9540:798-1307(+)